MATNTTRMSLVKPDPADPVDIAVINTNMNDIDQHIGCQLITDGATVADGDKIDGGIIRERSSDITYDTRASGGTFVRKMITYPYVFYGSCSNSAVNTSGSLTLLDWGINTFNAARSKNASNSDTNASNFWVAPTRGIYLLSLNASWSASTVGSRMVRFSLNATGLDKYATSQVPASTSAGFYTTQQIQYGPILLAAGDVIKIQIAQDSGGDLVYEAEFFACLVSPCQ